MKKPNLYHLLYLWFKALFYSADFKILCEKENQLKGMQLTYPNIYGTYKLWGNIFISEDVDVAFGLWVENNQPQINQQEFLNYRVVRSGEPITPQYGYVYYTIASDATPTQMTDLYISILSDNFKQLQRAINDSTLENKQLRTINGNYFPFNRTGFNKADKLDSNAKRLAAYVAYEQLGINLSKPKVLDSLKAFTWVFNSGEEDEWSGDIWQTEKARLKNKGLSLNDYQDDDVRAEIMSFKTLAQEGQKLIAHATNNSFPNYTTYKP